MSALVDVGARLTKAADELGALITAHPGAQFAAVDIEVLTAIAAWLASEADVVADLGVIAPDGFEPGLAVADAILCDKPPAVTR